MVQVYFLLLLISGVILVGSLPPGKTKVYSLLDQKQSGDINIRVNLKDIQIIALLGGDYENDDYEYDYEIPSDYTDFPVQTTTSNNAVLLNSNTSSITSTESLSTSTIPTVNIEPKPLTTTTTTPKSTTLKIDSTTKLKLTSISTTKQPSSTTIKTTPIPSKIKQTTLKPAYTTITRSTTGSSSQKGSSTPNKTPVYTTITRLSTGNVIEKDSSTPSSEKSNKTLTYSYQTGLTGGRIPVIVLQQNQNEEAAKAGLKTSHVTILHEEAVNSETERAESLGEIDYRKCPSGLVRDKNGICRKYRRPTFDISRLASTLKSKLRRPDVISDRKDVPGNE